MVEAIEKARKSARVALETLYDGVCTCFTYGEVVDTGSKITRHKEITAFSDVPCRISFESANAVNQGEVPALTQSIKLFLAPEITIRPGSKIAVTQNGKTVEYAMSGEPAMYSTHQEINLEIFKGWA